MNHLNQNIADTFQEYADLLEIRGENPFRVRAYRNASDTVRNLNRDLLEMIQQDEDLSKLPTIGKDIAKKIEEIIQTGRFQALEKVKKTTPATLTQLLEIQGLGPKRVRKLYEALAIKNIHELEQAAIEGQLSKVEGFGPKTIEKIIQEIKSKFHGERRYPLASVEGAVNDLVAYLRKIPGVKTVKPAGSYRRRQVTVGDLDILVSAKRGAKVTEQFIAYPEVEEVLSQGPTRSTVRWRSGLQVDLRVVAEASYGAALLYFTGSKAHNIALRQIAIRQGKKINEYGLYLGDKKIAGQSEEEIYKNLGLLYIEPELRENRGEIKAAQEGCLPDLIKLEDIRGNLHAHTNASDGRHSLAELADIAKAAGFQYFAITDHSKRLTVANGLDEKRLRKQIEEIDELNQQIEGITILKGIEVDILEDGRLDLNDSVLKELDVCVASIHSYFELDEESQTERLIRAMDNPYVHIIGHPTGRLIQKREAYPLNLERIMDAAKDKGCYLELNTQTKRLDLSDLECRMAKEKGVKIAISTDAHKKEDFMTLRFGIDQARRAWLTKEDVINTRSWPELKKLMQR